MLLPRKECVSIRCKIDPPLIDQKPSALHPECTVSRRVLRCQACCCAVMCHEWCSDGQPHRHHYCKMTRPSPDEHHRRHHPAAGVALAHSSLIFTPLLSPHHQPSPPLCSSDERKLRTGVSSLSSACPHYQGSLPHSNGQRFQSIFQKNLSPTPPYPYTASTRCNVGSMVTRWGSTTFPPLGFVSHSRSILVFPFCGTVSVVTVRVMRHGGGRVFPTFVRYGPGIMPVDTGAVQRTCVTPAGGRLEPPSNSLLLDPAAGPPALCRPPPLSPPFPHRTLSAPRAASAGGSAD